MAWEQVAQKIWILTSVNCTAKYWNLRLERLVQKLLKEKLHYVQACCTVYSFCLDQLFYFLNILNTQVVTTKSRRQPTQQVCLVLAEPTASFLS